MQKGHENTRPKQAFAKVRVRKLRMECGEFAKELREVPGKIYDVVAWPPCKFPDEGNPNLRSEGLISKGWLHKPDRNTEDRNIEDRNTEDRNSVPSVIS